MVSCIIGCSYQISICTNGELLMSKYQELSKTFAESVQLQAKYVSDCCAFSNVFFHRWQSILNGRKTRWPLLMMRVCRLRGRCVIAIQFVFEMMVISIFSLCLLSIDLIMKIIVIS